MASPTRPGIPPDALLHAGRGRVVGGPPARDPHVHDDLALPLARGADGQPPALRPWRLPRRARARRRGVDRARRLPAAGRADGVRQPAPPRELDTGLTDVRARLQVAAAGAPPDSRGEDRQGAREAGRAGALAAGAVDRVGHGIGLRRPLAAPAPRGRGAPHAAAGRCPRLRGHPRPRQRRRIPNRRQRPARGAHRARGRVARAGGCDVRRRGRPGAGTGATASCARARLGKWCSSPACSSTC